MIQIIWKTEIPYLERTPVNQIMQKDSLSKIWNKQAASSCISTKISLSYILSNYCRPKQLPENNYQNEWVNNYNSKDICFLMILFKTGYIKLQQPENTVTETKNYQLKFLLKKQTILNQEHDFHSFAPQDITIVKTGQQGR